MLRRRHRSAGHDQTAPTSSSPLYITSERPDRWRVLQLDAFMVAAVALCIVAVMFQIWHRPIHVPLDYDGDGLIYGSWVRGLVETGWVNHNPRLGAPLGQIYYDYPLGADNLQYVALKILSVATHDWAVLLNVFFYLTFPVVAASAYVCQRWLGVARLGAAVGALVFAFLPLHFIRGVDHILLSSYAIVPVAVLLAARAASGIHPWQPTSSHDGPRALLRAAPWLLAALALGSNGAYYFIFGLIVIACFGVFAGAVHRSLRPVAAAVTTSILAVVAFLLNNASTLLFWWRNGNNSAVARRSIVEIDAYSLRLVELISPQPTDRIGVLAALGRRLTTPAPTFETTQFLGVIGAVGLVMLLGAGLLTVVGRHRSLRGLPALCAATTIVIILISTSGGLAWIGELIGFSQIRAWSRITVFVAFMVLTALALWSGPAMAKALASGDRRRYGAVGIAVLLVAFAVVDQTPRPLLPHADAEGGARFLNDRSYFAAVEARLPPDAGVYELPYRPFPEEPTTYRSEDYDLLRPYLNTHGLRWSYGGVRGRGSEWQRQLVGEPPAPLLDDLAATSFQGVLVDRFGYPDAGREIEAGLTAELGDEPFVDSSGRWAFYDIRARRALLLDRIGEVQLAERGQRLLDAPWLDRTGCWGTEAFDATHSMTWCRRNGTLVVTTEHYPQDVRLDASVVAPMGEATLTLIVDGQRHDVLVGADQRSFQLTLHQTSRVMMIHFATDASQVPSAPDPRDLYFKLIDARVHAM